MLDLSLSNEKRQAIVREFGASGERWIDQFPALLEACVSRWDLELTGRATAGLPINVIFFATMKGEEVVLKLGHSHPEQKTEMITLGYYKGQDAPRLIDCDVELGATLMERVWPGTTFREWRQDISRSRERLPLFNEISVRVDSELPSLPWYSEWLRRAFKAFNEKFDQHHPFAVHVKDAWTAWEMISEAHKEAWLLHGDLHHENILEDDQRGWRAIDPKGVIGPRIMEPARFLHNFMEDEVEGVDSIVETTVDQLCEILAIRYETFAEEMDVGSEWLARATYVDDVLSHCWTLNDGYSIEYVRVEAAHKML